MNAWGALGEIVALAAMAATATGCDALTRNCNNGGFTQEPVVYVGFDRVVEPDAYTIEGTTDAGAFSCSLADDAGESERCNDIYFLASGSQGAFTESDLRIPPGGRGGLSFTGLTRSLSFVLRAGDREVARGSWDSIDYETYEPNGEGCTPVVERANLYAAVRP